MLWSPAASSDRQRRRVLARVKVRRYAPPLLRGAGNLDAGSAHALRLAPCLTMPNHDPLHLVVDDLSSFRQCEATVDMPPTDGLDEVALMRFRGELRLVVVDGDHQRFPHHPLQLHDHQRAQGRAKDSDRYKVAKCIQAEPVFCGFGALGTQQGNFRQCPKRVFQHECCRYPGTGWAGRCRPTWTTRHSRPGLFRRPAPVPNRARPDCAHIHRELKRNGVTLQLLWEEYLQVHPGGYRYTQICEIYRSGRGGCSRRCGRVHRADEKTFVDFSGKRPTLVDRRTGELRPVELFVAALGAGSLTYARRPRPSSWPTGSPAHIHMVEFWRPRRRPVGDEQDRGELLRPGRARLVPRRLSGLRLRFPCGEDAGLGLDSSTL